MEWNNKCMDSNITKSKIITNKKEKLIRMHEIYGKKRKKRKGKTGLVAFLSQIND